MFLDIGNNMRVSYLFTQPNVVSSIYDFLPWNIKEGSKTFSCAILMFICAIFI